MQSNKSFINSHTARYILPISLSLFCISFYLRWLYPGSRIGIDDANIFFSYASNLAAGNGISYGAQFERVEGYTSTLWMLICAFSFYLNANEAGIFLASNFLTTATLTIAILILKRFQLQLNVQGASSYHILFFLFVAGSPSYLLWMLLSLMDTALWGLILMCMLYAILFPPNKSCAKSWIIFGLPFVISGLVRPEAMVITPLFLFLLFLSMRRNQIKGSGGIAFVIFALFLFVISLLTIFRILYFNYPLPSTYYAKVSPSFVHNITTGWTYSFNFLNSNIAVALGLLASPLLFYLKWQSATMVKSMYKSQTTSAALTYFFLPVICALILLPVVTGGDHFSLFRFYQPLYPILLLALLSLAITSHPKSGLESTLSGVGARPKIKFLCITIVGVWAAVLLNNPSWLTVITTPMRPLLNEFSIANAGRAQGHAINKLFSSHPDLLPKVGVIVAGGIAMTYKGAVIDMMGLNNSYVAHFPGDRHGPKNHAAFEKDAFFNLDIDYLNENPNDFYLVQTYLKNLFYDERFFNLWKWGVLSTKNEPAHKIEGFFHNRYIEKLLQSEDYIFIETLALDKENWTGRWLKLVN